MKLYLQYLLAGAMVFAITPAFVRAEDAEKTDTSSQKKEEPDNDQIEINSGSKADFDQICEDAGVTGEQLDKIHALAAKRVERLRSWATSEDGKKYIELRKQMTATRRDRSAQLKKTQSATQPVDFDTKISEINAVLRPLGRQYLELRTSTRGEVLKELTAEQQEKAVNANLTRRINRAFEPAKLTDDQQQKVKGIVDEAVSDYVKKTPLDQDLLMQKLLGVQNSVTKMVRDEVLTDEQREAIKKPKMKDTPTTQKD